MKSNSNTTKETVKIVCSAGGALGFAVYFSSPQNWLEK
jgi:hypothetical protein